MGKEKIEIIKKRDWFWWWRRKGRERRRTSFLFVLGGSLVVFVLSGVMLEEEVGWRELSNISDVRVEEVKEEVGWPVNMGGAGPPAVGGLSGAVLDVGSGRFLWSKNLDVPRLPASTTKIMTALVVLDAVDKGELRWDQPVVVPEAAAKVEGQKVGLSKGELVTVENLLYALLLGSGNDAVESLVAVYPGGKEAMVAAMNERVTALGLVRTHFTNPDGFDEYLHFTTAEDLARLATAALKEARFARMVATTKAEFFSVDGKIGHRVENLNELLGEVPGVKGVKTGWSEVARENLVTAVERDGHEVMVVVLSSDNRFGDSRKLIEWVFENFSWPGN